MDKFLKVCEKYIGHKDIRGLNNVITMQGEAVSEHFCQPCHAWLRLKANPMDFLADFSNPNYGGGNKKLIKQWDELLSQIPMCARVLYDQQKDFDKPYLATTTVGKYTKEMFFVLVLRRYSWEFPTMARRALMFHNEWGISPTNAVMLSTYYQSATDTIQEQVEGSHIAFDTTTIGKLLRDTLNDVVQPLGNGHLLNINPTYTFGIANAVGTEGGTKNLTGEVYRIYKERAAGVELVDTVHITHDKVRKFIGLTKPKQKVQDIKMKLKDFITIADEVINGW